MAERKPDAKDFPDAPIENLVHGSLVFTPPPKPVSKRSHYIWWRCVPGACWKHTEGPSSNIDGKANYPVVQIAWEDATAYAKCVHKRLPTEKKFEYAARGGLDRKTHAPVLIQESLVSKNRFKGAVHIFVQIIIAQGTWWELEGKASLIALVQTQAFVASRIEVLNACNSTISIMTCSLPM